MSRIFDKIGRTVGNPLVEAVKAITVAMLVLAAVGAYGEDKAEIFVQLGYASTVTSVALSPDGKYALSGSNEKQ